MGVCIWLAGIFVEDFEVGFVQVGLGLKVAKSGWSQSLV